MADFIPAPQPTPSTPMAPQTYEPMGGLIPTRRDVMIYGIHESELDLLTVHVGNYMEATSLQSLASGICVTDIFTLMSGNLSGVLLGVSITIGVIFGLTWWKEARKKSSKKQLYNDQIEKIKKNSRPISTVGG